jgi:ElaB/YqjD/DUF883 family membrane-anchored ribosome-binding protein
VEPAGRSVYESPDTVVRLEPRSKIAFLHDTDPTHPVSLTQEQIEILLTSFSARNKIGLLRSFAGDPGTPRLFEQTDIRLLSGPLQEAFAQAKAEEAVVFYLAKPGTGARRRVTSGTIVVQGDALLLSIANFWHPLITTASEVGSTDRLHDIRETTGYVQDHPWTSVGEQDFAVFFDDPRYQTTSRQGSLFDYPERTLSVAYQSYLNANPDPIRRTQEVQDAVQQATLGKVESLAIAELKKRITDLEWANAELAARVPKTTGSLEPSPPPVQEPVFQPNSKSQSQDQIQEFMKRLEERVAELEHALKESESNRK